MLCNLPNPPGTPELWLLNCTKTELAVSALEVECPAPKNVVITIELTTSMTGIFYVSLALLLTLNSSFHTLKYLLSLMSFACIKTK